MRSARELRLVVTAAASALALLAVGCAPPPPTWHRSDPVAVVAEGLNGPFGLDARGSRVYVAESTPGQVTEVNLKTGAISPSVTGLVAPASVARIGHRLAVVTGEAMGPPMDGTSSVFVAVPGGEPELLANLLDFELANNPDGQLQFDPATGDPLDALSNPFSVIEQRGPGLVLVADAGANAVLSVSRTGEVSTFFVPPVINTGACEGLENNDPDHTGCDPVPTGLAYGPGNNLYVSTLTAEVPGEGRVYVLDARTGDVRRVIEGFSGPTGVAADPDGSIYVSEVLHDAPPMDGPPPDDFDPSTVGRIVRVEPDGTRKYLQVTMPTGLDWEAGRLYASTWSIAGFLGIEDAGQVVAIKRSAFTETDEPAST